MRGSVDPELQFWGSCRRDLESGGLVYAKSNGLTRGAVHTKNCRTSSISACGQQVWAFFSIRIKSYKKLPCDVDIIMFKPEKDASEKLHMLARSSHDNRPP